MKGHDSFMREALRQAQRALEAGEVPVGAVVVHGGRMVGVGFNQPISSEDPTAHAEIVALRDAARTLGNYRLSGATLYVTIEPCLICAGAVAHARVGTLVYGAAEPKTGAVRSVMRVLDHPSLNHRVAVVASILEDECRGMIQEFFAARRHAANKET